MSQQYRPGRPEDIPTLDQQALRDRYLVEQLLTPGEIRVVATHFDRVVTVGAVPTDSPLKLETVDELRSENFLDRRELGIVNTGGDGVVVADGERYELAKTAVLYLGRGTVDVTFESSDAADPAKFYGFSAPAHTAYPNTLVTPEEGTIRELGDQVTSNRRTLRQCIHENGVKSCQIVMGVTSLHAGSMWNTMPAHTHDRRTEVYHYFDLEDDQRVVHLMGDPKETRHLMVANGDVVLSPSWSLHSGVGSSSYSFVWAMAGENQSFDDMDSVPITDMR
ncbi:5-dehydro-4-deoxy-D-glucuronate isomerase [Pseudoclavibacter sp. RFBG4]|uniref:5-dehydro-4-deoxy-D-glucuronate isomerase n=1 Tax=Pseudoclavibacter sp. RFBG4 TaxID=2080575 RepID=UPI000CE90B61|nr:5-dehydro-4-deoxy-D-glucuronate isomerase [Pseudoclavibacter sp. RFBG4]PPG35720.1 5-dehydro-4-deoxy-D-glucuronate isomerase [Pseudoclavibacter sp. RFBG4]